MPLLSYVQHLEPKSELSREAIRKQSFGVDQGGVSSRACTMSLPLWHIGECHITISLGAQSVNSHRSHQHRRRSVTTVGATTAGAFSAVWPQNRAKCTM